jgi:hypothetical protein
VYLHLQLIRYFYSRIPSKYAGEDAPKVPGTLSAAARAPKQAPKQAPKTPPRSGTPPASSSYYLRKVDGAVDGPVDAAKDAVEDVEGHNRHRKGWE